MVDEAFGLIRRPPGVRFDSGGIGKGLAADLLAEWLAAHARFVVDCGGDLRVGGTAIAAEPFDVLVEHPLSGEHTHSFRLGGGAVATSGLNVRVWRRDDGRYAHHLIDPATGEPAWTGLIGATALGPTAVEAETLAKAALLSGPEGARRVLAGGGGLIVHDHGEVELVGRVRPAPRTRSRCRGFGARRERRPMNPPVEQHAWWLASRASGIVALALVTISVTLGLVMAGRVMRAPGRARVMTALHEQTALAGLLAIVIHGITLLGDAYLNPGLIGISVPGAIDYRPLWTGLGIGAGYLAAALGLTFYVRALDRRAALAPGAPADDPRLRARGRPHARRRHRRVGPLDARLAA